MDLTLQELKAKEFMYNQFIPALHELVCKSNPNAYKKWGGNTCRQTAIFGVYYLKKLLPNYEWSVYDGDFNDTYMGRKVEYNHAWIHGVDKKNRRGLLVDLSRVNKERLFLLVSENKYPKNHPEYKHQRLINKVKIDIDERMQDYEYYTGMQGDKFIKSLNLEI